MKKKITKEQFKKEYAELKEKFGAVKAELKKIKAELTPLCRHAEKFARLAENSLYIEESGVPIRPAFKKLDDMLDDVFEWSMARDAVGDAAECIP